MHRQATASRAAVRPSRKQKIKKIEALEARSLLAGMVSGLVFRDVDLDGHRDAQERGVGGVQVTAYDDQNRTLAATVTSSDPAGTYALMIPGSATRARIAFGNLPAGLAAGPRGPDSGGAVASVNFAGGTAVASLGLAPAVEFAGLETDSDVPKTPTIVPEVSLSGSVYVDLDDDGLRDPEEPGIPDITVTLGGTESRTTTTDADGQYSFGQLPIGTYSLTEGPVAGYVDGKDTIGTAGGNVSNDLFTDISLTAGQSGVNYLFGERLPNQNPSSISGLVYNDEDLDGLPDAGEDGIPGVEVRLSGPESRTTTTAADGSYTFDNLAPGVYTVTEIQPPEYFDALERVGSAGGDASVNDVISNITLAAGVDAINYDFGEILKTSVPGNPSLSGHVYVDADDDGVFDPGEDPIPGVTITLSGTTSATTTTDAGGSYTFFNLPAGVYTVTETQPPGFDDGKDAVGSAGGVLGNDVISQITLAADSVAINYDFGERVGQVPLSSLAGTVYEDDDNDGVLDPGEAGIAGVVVTLTGPVTLTTITDLEGNYTFSELPAGTYTVTETQPPDYIDGLDTAGTAGGTVTNDVISNITLPAGVDATGYLFGERDQNSVPGNPSLSGHVYVDADDDGVFDPGEDPIPGVTITLSGTSSATTTTDADGAYTFFNLDDGVYTVTETQPPGFADGKDTVGSAGGVLGNDVISQITLTEDSVAINYDFGERPLVVNDASLSGLVYVDADEDGIPDPGEDPIPGVTVVLTGPVTLTTTTAADGTYTFTDLPAGTYTVTETQPPGFDDGQDRVGSAGGTLGNDVISNISLTAGTNAVNYDFGEIIEDSLPPRPSLSGQVYVDSDDDGIRDPGEPPIPGTTVVLTGPVTQTTTTAADGSYTFFDLPAGVYTVTEAQPAGFADGKDKVGTAGGTLGNDVISDITLAEDTVATGYDFGERPLDNQRTTLSGTVFVDLDRDTVFDVGEPTLSGVTITLRDGTGTSIGTTLTGPGGTYSFTNLTPGLYQVVETQPPGYGSTTPNELTVDVPLAGRTGVDFGESLAQLSGSVFADANDDGVRQPGEAGIPNTPVELLGTDDRGVLVSRSTTTDADGRYTFADILAGTYRIVETQPAGFLDGKDAVGTLGGTLGNDVILNVTVPPGETGSRYDFGELTAAPAPTSISGRVFDDVDRSNSNNAGDLPIPDVLITLTGTDTGGSAVSRTTTTGTDGTYSFGNLTPGVYTVTETQPTGFNDGPDYVGTRGGTLGNDVISNITLAAGLSGENYDFSEYNAVSPPPPAADLSGRVFVDPNRNCLVDPGERVFAGIVITLTGTDQAGNPVSRSTTTDSTGSYTFTDLPQGNYSITSATPGGSIPQQACPGSQGGTPTSPTQLTNVPFNVAAGDSINNNFTVREILSICLAGRVYIDSNNNGRRDASDAPLPRVAVILTGVDFQGRPVAPMTEYSKSDGTFHFINLRPGTYQVRVVKPNSLASGPITVGTGGGTVAGNDRIVGIPLGTNEVVDNYDFGFRPNNATRNAGIIAGRNNRRGR